MTELVWTTTELFVILDYLLEVTYKLLSLSLILSLLKPTLKLQQNSEAHSLTSKLCLNPTAVEVHECLADQDELKPHA